MWKEMSCLLIDGYFLKPAKCWWNTVLWGKNWKGYERNGSWWIWRYYRIIYCILWNLLHAKTHNANYLISPQEQRLHSDKNHKLPQNLAPVPWMKFYTDLIKISTVVKSIPFTLGSVGTLSTRLFPLAWKWYSLYKLVPQYFVIMKNIPALNMAWRRIRESRNSATHLLGWRGVVCFTPWPIYPWTSNFRTVHQTTWTSERL
jgi:hypothetical protein